VELAGSTERSNAGEQPSKFGGREVSHLGGGIAALVIEAMSRRFHDDGAVGVVAEMYKI
jgi:hypothetical protein